MEPYISLIFPHQLYSTPSLTLEEGKTFLIEEHLFFKELKFHKQKIAYHRASMKSYEKHLRELGAKTTYIDSTDERSDIRQFIAWCSEQNIENIQYADTTDNWLEKRITSACKKHNIALHQQPSQLFINSQEDLKKFFKPEKKKFLQAEFYKQQRKSREILVDGMMNPIGGKWSFDEANRKKYPKKKQTSVVHYPHTNEHYDEAITYTEKHFSNNPGHLPQSPLYPFDFGRAERWLDQFLEYRFAEFGPYEDAIVPNENILHHSVLTPMLNTGLLSPEKVLNKILDYSNSQNIPINTTEGFVRQIMGWREFMRGMYELKGTEQRNSNFWGFERKIPQSFYDGTTGIPPIDTTIQKVLEIGYCHHIERLMVLGNFMVLCEFHPHEVYRWFMELFIDAYDWVMVPNIYGMSQFADGGLLSTKPYISSSNYILKMSDYKKGEWQEVWDGLFWRFMHVHRDFFTSNPRIGMLVSTLDRMSKEKLDKHIENAERFLKDFKS